VKRFYISIEKGFYYFCPGSASAECSNKNAGRMTARKSGAIMTVAPELEGATD